MPKIAQNCKNRQFSILDKSANSADIYDPQVSPNQIESVLGKISKSTDDNNFDPDEGSWHFEESIYKAANSSDAIVITTEWNEFSNIDWSNLSKSMRRPAWVFDTRSIVDVSYLQSLGLNVWRVGLG